MTEVGSWNAEVGGQRRFQVSVDGDRKTESGRQRSEIRRQMTEDRLQKTEDRG
jgi:hypothetical protein